MGMTNAVCPTRSLSAGASLDPGLFVASGDGAQHGVDETGSCRIEFTPACSTVVDTAAWCSTRCSSW
jgi:hypothetical protein